MATIGKRAATWSNSDGLVVGFGTNSPAIAGANAMDVRLVVDTGFTSTGTNTITVGDASDADGFITTTAATSATMASAGAVILVDGVYAFGATDTGAAELKSYSAATDVVLASAQTDWTAGSATMVVTYLKYRGM